MANAFDCLKHTLVKWELFWTHCFGIQKLIHNGDTCARKNVNSFLNASASISEALGEKSDLFYYDFLSEMFLTKQIRETMSLPLQMLLRVNSANLLEDRLLISERYLTANGITSKLHWKVQAFWKKLKNKLDAQNKLQKHQEMLRLTINEHGRVGVGW